MVGHAEFRKVDSKNIYGTGCFMLLNTGETAVKSKSRDSSPPCVTISAPTPT